MTRRGGFGFFATLLLAFVFVAALLLSMATGASVYRRVAERTESNARGRVGLTYLSAKLHGFDESGMAEAGSFKGTDAIYLFEGYEGYRYETVLYVHDGWLRELVCEAGREEEFRLEDGTAVSEAASLAATRLQDGLFEVALTGLDGQTERELVYQRSDGGGV